MQQFTYTAKDPTGQLIHADVDATDEKEAVKLITAKQLFPLEVNQKAGALHISFIEKFTHRISVKEKVVFTRQLATMVKAGLPIAKALRLLQEQVTNPKLKEVVQSLSANIEGGTSLSQAFRQYIDLFGPIYISMVEAGEASGNLDDVLLKLADQEEKSAAIRSKIRGALTYPVVVLVVLMLVAVLMLTMVLPQVGKMYTDLHQSLPLFTKIMLGTSHLVTKFWYLFILLLIGAGYGLRMYLKSPPGVAQVDSIKVSAPVFGSLMQKLYMARFARTLGSLIASGVPIIQALTIVAQSMNNVHMEEEVTKIADRVKSGVAMSQLVGQSHWFLPLVSQMLSVGEQTGTLGDSLEKVASYYEDEVDQAVKNISTLIEPATMIVLGGLVAFLIAAVLLPIYGLVSKVGVGGP